MDTSSIPPLKYCPRCDKEYPATTEYFFRHPKGKYGLTAPCKACKAKIDAARKKTPEYRQKAHEYNTSERRRLWAKEYNQRPDVKAKKREIMKRPKYKEYSREFKKTPKQRELTRKRRQTSEFKEWRRHYYSTGKGMILNLFTYRAGLKSGM